ncbi:MAG: nuclear transport factor 2 family protein [Candidatus Binataceae bacterium]
MDLGELARKLLLLEDLEAIKTLKYQYCAFCDDSYNADGIAGLFVEDGIWDGGDFGRCEGRQAIRKFFEAAPRGLSLAAHQVMNPIIKVEGDRAAGEWKLFQPCTLETRNGPRAMWLAANYHDEYVRTSSGCVAVINGLRRLR